MTYLDKQSVRVIVRAWNKDGYHKDILTMNLNQIMMFEIRVANPRSPKLGMLIDPLDFPEMVHFEVLIEELQ